MSKYKDGSFIIIECDECGERFDVDLDDYDYSEVNEVFKEEGFISRKINDEWLNFCCIDCLRAFKSKHDFRRR